MNIGNKIKELRKQRGITQEQLANSIGISFQAVSKWENNIALPDVANLPVLASYFGVSLDCLFDYDIHDIKSKTLAIAKESWKYRSSDVEKAKSILEDGLKQYPDNDILLENLLYVIDFNEYPDEVLKIASKIVDVTRDESIKYDAYRYMAYAYKVKDDMESVRAVLDLIPEIYFSRLSEKACVLDGEEKWYNACKAEGEALFALMRMKGIIAECYIEKGERQKALKEYEKALAVLEALEANDDWNCFRDQFEESIAEIKSKMN